MTTYWLAMLTKSTGCSCGCPDGVCGCGGSFSGGFLAPLHSTTPSEALVEAQAKANGNDARRYITSAKLLTVESQQDILAGVLADRDARTLAAKRAQYERLKDELGL